MSDLISREKAIKAIEDLERQMVIDGVIGERTFYSIMGVKGSNVPPQPTRPKIPKRASAFICECCGGNDTEEKNGKVYCAYCGTLLKGAYANPMSIARPKPMPTVTTR